MDAYTELKEAYEIREHLIVALREENERLRRQLADAPAVAGATQTIPAEIESAIIEYSFGNEQLAAANRTFAIRALAAKTSAEDVAEQIIRGRDLG